MQSPGKEAVGGEFVRHHLIGAAPRAMTLILHNLGSQLTEGVREHRRAPGMKPALNTEESSARSCSRQWIRAQGTIDAVFAPNRRDTKRPILRLGGNAWPFLPDAANRCRSNLHPRIHERERHRDFSI